MRGQLRRATGRPRLGTMRTRRVVRSAGSGLLVAALAGAVPAVACSVVEGYKVPTSIELARQADTILLARVRQWTGPQKNPPIGELQLVPETLIAGAQLPGPLRIEGHHGAGMWQPVSSDPMNLRDANPGAFTGGCNRYVFARGSLLLLFLHRSDDGALRIINAPFARTLEDVPDADAPWVRAVRLYDAVADLPAAERRVRLIEERARLRASGDWTDRIIADDITRQLQGGRTMNHD